MNVFLGENISQFTKQFIDESVRRIYYGIDWPETSIWFAI